MPVNKMAAAVVRELPAASIKRFLDAFSKGSPIAAGGDNGGGCGQGCGAGCSDATGLVIDRFGHTGLSAKDLENARTNIAAVRNAVKAELGKMPI